jgi:hypothetical protein
MFYSNLSIKSNEYAQIFILFFYHIIFDENQDQKYQPFYYLFIDKLQHIYIFVSFRLFPIEGQNQIEYLKFLSSLQIYRVNLKFFLINLRFIFDFFPTTQYNCLVNQNTNFSPSSNHRYYYHFHLNKNFLFISN